jgi:hypothetical protein
MLTACQEPPAMIVVLHPYRVEEDLAAGEIVCPRCDVPAAGVVLGAAPAHPPARPLGHGSTPSPGTVPLVPGDPRTGTGQLPARRADSTEVVGVVLLARAAGRGYRRIAADLRRPVSSVCGWLRPVRGRHVTWLYSRGVQHAYRHDQEFLTNQPVRANALADALEAPRHGRHRVPTSVHDQHCRQVVTGHRVHQRTVAGSHTSNMINKAAVGWSLVHASRHGEHATDTMTISPPR